MSEYDWVIGIGIPILLALIYYFFDSKNSGLVIFVFLNIGLGIMVYANLIEFWVLVLSIMFTILLACMNKGGK